MPRDAPHANATQTEVLTIHHKIILQQMLKAQIIQFLEEFEKESDPVFLEDDNLFDAIYIHKINLTAFPKFNNFYTEFLERFL